MHAHPRIGERQGLYWRLLGPVFEEVCQCGHSEEVETAAERKHGTLQQFGRHCQFAHSTFTCFVQLLRE